MYGAIARGTGKTFAAAIYEAQCMYSMPRCTRLLLGPSYRKMVTDLLPGITLAWEELGYIRDKHYVIGVSDIPKKKGWPDPFYAPAPSFRQFMIHWHTGAAERIGSADRKVTMNGLSLDGITADELKLIPEDTFNEILKTNRANPNRPWSHLPEHNSIVGFTDKYWTRKGGNWVMKKKRLADMKAVENIILLQTQLNEMTLAVGGKVIYSNPALAQRIIKLLNNLRNDTVAFFEAAVYANIPAITPQFILQMKRNMGENEFRASMLNHDLIRNDVKEYFYPMLNESTHGYVADDFDKLDKANFDFTVLKGADCTFDTDLDKNRAIEISCDWGGTINTMVVCQERGNALNVINSFFTKHPEGTKQLAKKFNDYYAPHKIKQLNFYYDPSGNNKRPEGGDSLAQEFANYLRGYGWKVSMMMLGAHNNPLYEIRYQLYARMLQPSNMRDMKYPNLFINRSNCHNVFISMLDAGLKRIGKKIEKDKSSEKPGSGVLPEHATHFSDCVDIIIIKKYGHLIDGYSLPTSMADAL